jgi:hypothetical protein
MKTSRMMFRYLSAVTESSQKMSPINLRRDIPTRSLTFFDKLTLIPRPAETVA